MDLRKTHKTRLSGFINQALKRTQSTLGNSSLPRTSKICNSGFIKDVVFGPRAFKIVPRHSLDRPGEQSKSQLTRSCIHLTSESCSQKFNFDEKVEPSEGPWSLKIGERILDSMCEDLQDPSRLSLAVGSQCLSPYSSAWSPYSSQETFFHLFSNHSTDSISVYSMSQSPDLSSDSITSDISSPRTSVRTLEPVKEANDSALSPLIANNTTYKEFEGDEDGLPASDPLGACLSRLRKAYQGKTALVPSLVGESLPFPTFRDIPSQLASDEALENILDFTQERTDSDSDDLWSNPSRLGLCGVIGDSTVIDSPCPSLPLPPLPLPPLPEDSDAEHLDFPTFGSLTNRHLHGSRNLQGHVPGPLASSVSIVPGGDIPFINASDVDDDRTIADIIHNSGNYCQARRRRTGSPLGALDIDILLSMSVSPLSLLSRGDSLPSDANTYITRAPNASKSTPNRDSLCLLPRHILERRSKEGARPQLICGPAF
ncbi:hypothetical protein CPB84DRAFT_202121 [Gymnopilus junonius]|uniref:Uncharacterized protein n=1 Tax=Gymnopilus junonius TaxID=109634 RepID=A0A9P5NYG2_GYMJU|nr:hypothetical protein CPB84DRAFT_202121 [Gymnopilus junonius]